MATRAAAVGSYDEAERSRQLRRAIIASTVGTTIEWYDFFLYSTASGLVFGRLFFPESDPLTGTLNAFGIYFVGFIARPVGAAIVGHYGDRLGRKAALIATLLLMGIGTFLVALVPRLPIYRYLGRNHANNPALYSGHRCRRGVGRLGASLHGMGAVEPSS